MEKKIVMVPDSVHWGWYVFWLLVFWPAIIVTLIIDSGKSDKFVPMEVWVKEEKDER